MNIRPSEKSARFGFGKNWKTFLSDLDEGRVNLAKESIVEFTGFENLKDKSLIDVGCGSGLFSYSAFLLGAERIVSFDFDKDSVEATRALWEKAGKPSHWKIEQGSVLDIEYIESLGTFDIVYSWGVLHHTGSMWEAIRNAARLVAPRGLFYIALYNRVDGGRGSNFWLGVKRRYVQGSTLTKRCIEYAYLFVYYILAPLMRFQNPLRMMREYRGNRGMDYWCDIVDWVGGYPYEYATVEEVFGFIKKEYPAFQLTNIKTTNNLGNNSFMYKND